MRGGLINSKPLRIAGNVQCPYCGRLLDDGPETRRTEEHVIGRKFVPKGYLENEWNLIVDACEDCNRQKGRLESGISCMSHMSVGSGPKYDDDVVEDVRRKLGMKDPATGRVRGATHPSSGKPVLESFARHKVSGSFGPARLSFSFLGPPQDAEGEAELAGFHVQAFFYLISNYNPDDPAKSRAFSKAESRYLATDDIQPVFSLRRSGFGHEVATELTRQTLGWNQVCWISTARGHFKTIMRKGPDAFFWAVEWNKNVRVIGLIRKKDQPCAVLDGLAELSEATSKPLSDGWRYREGIALLEEQDILFPR